MQLPQNTQFWHPDIIWQCLDLAIVRYNPALNHGRKSHATSQPIFFNYINIVKIIDPKILVTVFYKLKFEVRDTFEKMLPLSTLHGFIACFL